MASVEGFPAIKDLGMLLLELCCTSSIIIYSIIVLAEFGHILGLLDRVLHIVFLRAGIHEDGLYQCAKLRVGYGRNK